MSEALLRNSMQTPDGTIITSRQRHDYVCHTDENGLEYCVDGGLDYLRHSSGDANSKVLSTSTADSFEEQRKYTTWGTRGINGDDPLRYVSVAEMESDHIEAVLETVLGIYPQIKQVMLTELFIRNSVKGVDYP